MGLRKDPETGNYILTAAKAAQNNRSSRKKYVKHNLQPKRQGIIGWVLSLFSFFQDPFKSSPIASDIGRQTSLVKNCRLAHSSGENIDELHYAILPIRDRLKAYLVDAETEADSYLDPLDTALNQEKAFLDECRPEKIRTRLETDLQREIDGLENVFGSLANKAAEDKIHLDNFRKMHSLPKTYYWGDIFTTGNIALIMGVVIFEFLMNSIFFAAANPLGLVGGAAQALVLSISTIIFGVFLGVAYQYNNVTAEGRGWIGKILFVVVPAATLFFLLLLTLARLAGEAGDLAMFKTAAREIQQHPFSGLLDLPSLGYFFFSVGVIAYTAFKYVSIMGRFPGLRRRVLHAEHSEIAYDAESSAAADHLRSMTEGQIEALDSLPLFIQDTLLSIKDIEMDFENVVDQLRNDCHFIGNASKLLNSYARSKSGNSDLEVNAFAENECQSSIISHEQKLAELRNNVALLIGREEIQQETVDRCRKLMNANLQSSIDILATKCAQIKGERYTLKLIEISDNPAVM